MGRLGTITRRGFLVASAAVTGGVVFGYWKYRQPYDNPLDKELADGEATLTPYVRIDADGITLIAPRAEMGQGVHTTLAALVAEELDVSLADVRVEHGPASNAYFNAVVLEEGLPFAQIDDGWLASNARGLLSVPAKFLGMQLTGGSSSTPDAYEKMRTAGAAARHVLIEAAARKQGVQADSLRTDDAHVITADGTRLSYLSLAVDAASIEPPASPALKDPSTWKLLGRTQPRVDMLAKCTGTAPYAIDVRLPGMRYATVRCNPHLGGGIDTLDATAALALPGVDQIVMLSDGFAVVASNTWIAFEAAKAVVVSWPKADYPDNTATMFAEAAAAFDGDSDSQFRDDGNVDAVLDDARSIVEAEYRVPYLAHATLEPLNATAWLQDDRLDVWAGNQNPTQARKEGVAITGLNEEHVHIHTTLMGGGFGRRSEMDFIKQSIELAKAVPGTPIKLTWTREEDTQHDTYRPLAIARLRGLASEGNVAAMDLQMAAQSTVASQMGRIGLNVPGPDVAIVQAAWDQPYKIEHYRVTGYRVPEMLPVSSWRSVGASQNGFFHESAIDELAHAAGLDPLEYRLRAMTHEPSRRVIEAAAEMSDWGSPLPEGHGRGIAFVLSFGVPTAEVIEVVIDNDVVRIIKAFAAVDVGIALDPGNIEAQVQGGLNFGLAAAIMGEISVAEGRVEQSNFHDYDAIRMHQAPRSIEVRILENGERIRGIGEPGTPPAAPALANAIFAAGGPRIRELPMNRHISFA